MAKAFARQKERSAPSAPQRGLPKRETGSGSQPLVIQRKASCACGGGCPSCQGKPGHLKVSQPGDAAEREAERVADTVMRMPAGPVGATGAEASNGSAPLKEQSHGAGQAVQADVASRIDALRGSGSPLEAEPRGFFETRFGTGLGQVRIHTSGDAAELSRDLGAKAFTVGKDIYFGHGLFRPHDESGRRLLAHELVHVQQGGQAIHRCKNKDDVAAYDAIIAEIKALDAYKTLGPGPKGEADTIIAEGKAKPDCLYFARKLKILFTTPEEGTRQVSEDIRKETAAAVTAETKRLETKEAKKTLDVEEQETADPVPEPAPTSGKAPDAKPAAPKKPSRIWTSYSTRFGGGSYKVDATDPTRIFVKVKVNLVPGGEGTWDDVKNIKKLEDQIEKHASRKGFTLNLEFVNPDNKADFVSDAETVTLKANPKWPDATNWGGDARTCAHELFHVLNFPLDRYNYIESHASNKKMLVEDRVHWFLEQMHKPEGFDNPASLMASGQYPIEEDICQIARLDQTTCLKAREKLAETKLHFRSPFGGFVPTAGYANIAGAHGIFLNYGLDLGIPLTRTQDWELFIGAHASLLGQLEGDKRVAFLTGARIGIEKMVNPSVGGLNLGAFLEGGAAFVSDRKRAGAGTQFKTGGYGYTGVSAGYKFSPGFLNVSLNAELGVGMTTQLDLHDPQSFIRSPQALPFFTAGLRAAWMF